MIEKIKNIPGGIMVIPLFLGLILNSFFPDFLEMGGFVTAISTGANPLIGGFLFCMGAGIKFKSASGVLKQGLSITLSKFLIGVGIGLLIAYFFDDSFLGLSSLAIIAAMTNSNGGLYAALTGEYGSKKDIGALAIISINDGPFLTMLALGTTGLITMPYIGLIGVIVPVILGMVLGNLDKDFSTFLTEKGVVFIPIFSFALGTNMNFEHIALGGLSGVFLALLTTFVGGFFNILFDRLSGGTGIAGAAASSTAGNAVATPAALVLLDSRIENIELITAQIAGASILTVVFTPILTAFTAKWLNKNSERKN